jgi:hypothetical protein
MKIKIYQCHHYFRQIILNYCSQKWLKVSKLPAYGTMDPCLLMSERNKRNFGIKTWKMSFEFMLGMYNYAKKHLEKKLPLVL